MRVLLLVSFVTCMSAVVAEGQDRFRLEVPGADVTAEVMLDERELVVVDQAGKVSRYSREPQLDSIDRAWIAYYSRSINQVIRWPANHSGNLQLGEFIGGTAQYRASQMIIRGADRVAERPVLPPAMPPQVPDNRGDRLRVNERTQDPIPANPLKTRSEKVAIESGFVDSLQSIPASPIFDSIFQGQEARSQMLQLATFDQRGSQLYLTRDRLSTQLTRDPVAESNWWVVPAGSRYVRIQHYDNGRITALSATRNQDLGLSAISQDPRQLWQVVNVAANRNRFVLENAMYSGLCMTSNNGQLALQPITYAPTQWWVPLPAPTLLNYEPFWRTVSQEVHLNTALPPAQVDLVNSHRNALIVLLADQRKGGQFQQIRIEPGKSVNVSLDRDAGSTIVESYEVRSPSGVWQRQQFTTAIPPRVIYDLSVYEEFLQSIAIDRTGKSPNPIEDVNYMPKSVGWIQIPPGAATPRLSSLDVMPQARAANNPGAVRRLDKNQFEQEPASPTESILNEFQSSPRKKF